VAPASLVDRVGEGVGHSPLRRLTGADLVRVRGLMRRQIWIFPAFSKALRERGEAWATVGGEWMAPAL
jgi:hypothetical protein